jgi:hypothetical protein
MAPEVGLGLRTTVRLEVYSLGSSLYQLLTGDWLNPSHHSLPTVNDEHHAVAHHTPTHRSHIPLSLRSIAMKAVSPSPANRRPIPTSSQPLCRAVPASPPKRAHRRFGWVIRPAAKIIRSR